MIIKKEGFHNVFTSTITRIKHVVQTVKVKYPCLGEWLKICTLDFLFFFSVIVIEESLI